MVVVTLHRPQLLEEEVVVTPHHHPHILIPHPLCLLKAHQQAQLEQAQPHHLYLFQAPRVTYLTPQSISQAQLSPFLAHLIITSPARQLIRSQARLRLAYHLLLGLFPPHQCSSHLWCTHHPPCHHLPTLSLPRASGAWPSLRCLTQS